jgi:NADH:ubiquinone reductase (non-electrogenic)
VDPWRFKISYDKLIIALGAEALTFGIHGVKEHAIFLREVRHAQEIRRKLLLNLMLSDMPGMQLLFCFCFNIFLGNKFICQVCLFNMNFFFFGAETGLSEEEKSRLLHCVVVGGGPTGVEFSGELSDFILKDVRQTYSHVKDYIHVTLIEVCLL